MSEAQSVKHLAYMLQAGTVPKSFTSALYISTQESKVFAYVYVGQPAGSRVSFTPGSAH